MVSQTLSINPIVIAGPTASGKSAYALQLAQQINGEIICGDSRQVYARMRIGTAGPSEEELQTVAHHGFHVVDPNESYDAGRFIQDTDSYVKEVQSRQKTPIIVGGTGLYLRAYRYGMQDVPPKSEEVREKLAKEKEQIGLDALYQKLKTLDPDTGKRPSELRQTHLTQKVRVDARWLLFFPDRHWLHERLKKRVDLMWQEGLVQEAVELRDYIGNKPLMHTMGYEEALLFADGKLSEEDAKEKILLRQYQYAKRQLTWFKKEPWWEVVSV